jgi:hypothetical protein
LPALDAIGFPTRGLPREALAERLAAWVRWPIERGSVVEHEQEGKLLRVHRLEVGGGGALVTVVEVKKRKFLPDGQIVCFLPAFEGDAIRKVDVESVDASHCPWEPWIVVPFPDRLRFRVANPFGAIPAAGASVEVSLSLLATRAESAPEGTRPAVIPASVAAQDPETPPELHHVSGRVEASSSWENRETGERCSRFRLSTPGGPLDVVVRARDADPGIASGGMLSAEGEFVGTLRR